MSDDPRIQQFKKMAEEDPENELGHFSLGRAYLEAGRFSEAAASLARVIELNPRMSKAYQLLSEAHDKAGARGQAIETATRGVKVADAQGDRMPCMALVGLLESWGAPVPALEKVTPHGTTEQTGGAEGFLCVRCGRPDGQLAKPPFKGDLGQRVFGHVCQGCWREWIGMGTKVINELGLQLSTKHGQDTYDQYMVEFLQLDQI